MYKGVNQKKKIFLIDDEFGDYAVLIKIHANATGI